jgi:uncharacterized protein (TIGR02996 family)
VPSADEFLWDILEHEAEDGPRLVFADWLDDQGEAAHAEWIRVQCALAAQPEEDDVWLQRKLREEELWPVLRNRWNDVITELGGALHRLGPDAFRRRFVRGPLHLHLDSVEVLDRAENRWTFVLGIDCLKISCHAEARVFASPQLRRVTGLNCERSGVTDAALAPLADSPHLGRLRTFDLFRNHVGPDGVRALLGCPSLTGLTDLRLDENKLGNAGAVILASAPACRTLENLELFENGIGDAGLLALAASPHLAGLRRLLLHGNEFGPAGVEALAASPYLTRLRELTLGAPEGLEACIPARRQLYARVGDEFDSWSDADEADWLNGEEAAM